MVERLRKSTPKADARSPCLVLGTTGNDPRSNEKPGAPPAPRRGQFRLSTATAARELPQRFPLKAWITRIDPSRGRIRAASSGRVTSKGELKSGRRRLTLTEPPLSVLEWDE